MKIFSLHNFIFGIFLFIGLYSCLNLSGYCFTQSATVYSGQNYENVVDGMSYSSSAAWQGYAYPRTLVSYSGDYYVSSNATYIEGGGIEVHVVTSEGDFVVFTDTSYSTSTTTGTCYLMGYPVRTYAKTYLNVKNTLASSSSITATFQFTATCTCNEESGLKKALEGLSGGNGGFSWTDNTNFIRYNTMSDDQNYNFNTSLTVNFDDYRLVDTNWTYMNFRVYAQLANGNTVLLMDRTNNPNYLSQQQGLSDVWVSTDIKTDSRPVFIYTVMTATGQPTPKISAYLYSDRLDITVTRTLKDALNVIDTRESSDWEDIGGSQEVTDLNFRSRSISDTLSDNNDFEYEAFEDFSDGLNDFGFSDWSLVPIATELTTTKNIITMFYNVLPFKIQWLFTSVMALGLIMMLLTVGTRVVQRTGDFTRAKPIRISEKHIYHHKSK